MMTTPELETILLIRRQEFDVFIRRREWYMQVLNAKGAREINSAERARRHSISLEHY